jgi:hypothetical protein
MIVQLRFGRHCAAGGARQVTDDMVGWHFFVNGALDLYGDSHIRRYSDYFVSI